MKRLFTELRCLSGQYQRKKEKQEKGPERQIKTSNTNVYLWEKLVKAAFFLKLQGVEKAPPCKRKTSWHTCVLKMQKLWTAFKSDLVEARRVSTEQKKKKEGGGGQKHIGSFSFSCQGTGVVMKITSLASLPLTFSTSCFDTSVWNFSNNISLLCQGETLVQQGDTAAAPLSRLWWLSGGRHSRSSIRLQVQSLLASQWQFLRILWGGATALLKI